MWYFYDFRFWFYWTENPNLLDTLHWLADFGWKNFQLTIEFKTWNLFSGFCFQLEKRMVIDQHTQVKPLVWFTVHMWCIFTVQFTCYIPCTVNIWCTVQCTCDVKCTEYIVYVCVLDVEKRQLGSLDHVSIVGFHCNIMHIMCNLCRCAYYCTMDDTFVLWTYFCTMYILLYYVHTFVLCTYFCTMYILLYYVHT